MDSARILVLALVLHVLVHDSAAAGGGIGDVVVPENRWTRFENGRNTLQRNPRKLLQFGFALPGSTGSLLQSVNRDVGGGVGGFGSQAQTEGSVTVQNRPVQSGFNDAYPTNNIVRSTYGNPVPIREPAPIPSTQSFTSFRSSPTPPPTSSVRAPASVPSPVPIPSATSRTPIERPTSGSAPDAPPVPVPLNPKEIESEPLPFEVLEDPEEEEGPVLKEVQVTKEEKEVVVKEVEKEVEKKVVVKEVEEEVEKQVAKDKPVATKVSSEKGTPDKEKVVETVVKASKVEKKEEPAKKIVKTPKEESKEVEKPKKEEKEEKKDKAKSDKEEDERDAETSDLPSDTDCSEMADSDDGFFQGATVADNSLLGGSATSALQDGGCVRNTLNNSVSAGGLGR